MEKKMQWFIVEVALMLLGIILIIIFGNFWLAVGFFAMLLSNNLNRRRLLNRRIGKS